VGASGQKLGYFYYEEEAGPRGSGCPSSNRNALRGYAYYRSVWALVAVGVGKRGAADRGDFCQVGAGLSRQSV
jgi:hypothetical protein